jgi:rod shape-determining protein MreD
VAAAELLGRARDAVRRAAPAGAALATVLAAHVGLAPHLALSGAAPDLPLVAVVAVALGRGPRAGAAFGFAAGLGADLFLATPLGTSALAYTVVGHVLGAVAQHRPGGPAAARCTPASACFACRTGRRATAGRSERRRAGIRHAVLLTAVGVGGGRLTVTVVSTLLGGVPFPGPAGLVPIAGVAVVSAPLGIPALAGVRRLGGRARPGARP